MIADDQLFPGQRERTFFDTKTNTLCVVDQTSGHRVGVCVCVCVCVFAGVGKPIRRHTNTSCVPGNLRNTIVSHRLTSAHEIAGPSSKRGRRRTLDCNEFASP